jgi:hypothetical protein
MAFRDARRAGWKSERRRTDDVGSSTRDPHAPRQAHARGRPGQAGGDGGRRRSVSIIGTRVCRRLGGVAARLIGWWLPSPRRCCTASTCAVLPSSPRRGDGAAPGTDRLDSWGTEGDEALVHPQGGAGIPRLGRTDRGAVGPAGGWAFTSPSSDAGRAARSSGGLPETRYMRTPDRSRSNSRSPTPRPRARDGRSTSAPSPRAPTRRHQVTPAGSDVASVIMRGMLASNGSAGERADRPRS